MHIPARVRLLLCGLLSAFPVLSIAQDASKESPASGGIIPEWQMEYENLTRETRTKYVTILTDASRLFNQKRIFECLNRIAEADAIFEKNPIALNLKGACYVEFRDFPQARVHFERALNLQKDFLVGIDSLPADRRRARISAVSNILFNLAEMEFVTNKWEEAHNRFEELLPDLDPANISMLRLVEFKYLVCKVKIGRMEEAGKLAEKHDFLDDSPYHYYSQSVLAYESGDTEAAERWRAIARKVFRNPALLAPWEDSMIEARYVKSFYGGDLEVESIGE